MDRDPVSDADRKIESLTRNLLEVYEELDVIYSLAGRGLSSFDPQHQVTYVLDEAMEIFEADLGWVICVNAEACHFEIVHRGVSEEIIQACQGKVVREVLGGGKSQVRYNLGRNLGRPEAEFPDSFLCAVIRSETVVYGVLCLGRRTGRPNFTAGDLKLADVLASQAAFALENTALHQRRLREEQRMIRLQEEVRLARSIQQNLLPKAVPVVEGYDIAGATLPASTVGGDYYDFIPVEEGRLALCLGDVSGKGMPAALLMAHLQAAIRGQTLMRIDPGPALAHSNTLLYHSTGSDRFATCFYGVLDVREHRLRYANAGHDRPLLISAGGDRSRELDTCGLVLGVIPEAAYPEDSVALEPGDSLLIYSDGIIDAADGEGREFGLDALRDLVRRRPGGSAADTLARVLDTVNAHAGGAPQTDDITVVVVQRQ